MVERDKYDIFEFFVLLNGCSFFIKPRQSAVEAHWSPVFHPNMFFWITVGVTLTCFSVFPYPGFNLLYDCSTLIIYGLQ